MNYVEHHFGDYARDTGHLSLLEHGVYRQLLDLYYVREAPLPLDKRALCRLIRATSATERRALDSVLEDFFLVSEDGYRHKRCDAEIARFRDKQAKAKRSAMARWGGGGTDSERNATATEDSVPTHCDGSANAYANASNGAMRTHCEGNAHQTPITRHQTPSTKHQPPDPKALRRNPSTGVARVEAEKPPKTPRASRLGLADLPELWSEFAREKRPDLDPGETWERFRDFWLGKPGKDGTKADWFATWRNWVRNERPGTAAGQGNGSKQAALEARNQAHAEEFARRQAEAERTIEHAR